MHCNATFCISPITQAHETFMSASAQGGKKMMLVSKVSRYTAAMLADAMNRFAGEDVYQDAISAEDILRMEPIKPCKRKGDLVYAWQYGNITILGMVKKGGEIVVQHVEW